MAALLAIARDEEHEEHLGEKNLESDLRPEEKDEDEGLDGYVLWRENKIPVRILREGNECGGARGRRKEKERRRGGKGAKERSGGKPGGNREGTRNNA